MVDKLFATQNFSSAEIVLIGSVSLLTFIPECIILSQSYAIQSLSSRIEDRTQYYHYLLVGLALTLLLLTPLLGSMLAFSAFFLQLVADATPVDTASLLFFRLRLLGCFFQCLIFCLRGFYAAHRNNRIFFTVIATTLILHMLLAQVLLTGAGLFPPLGIQGIGLSYAIAMFFGLIIYAEQLWRDFRFLPPSLPRFNRLFSLLKVSIPLTFHGLVDHFGTTLIFTTTASTFGLLPLASLHLVSSIQGISPGAGFGLTALTEVSKARAKSLKAANQIGFTILCIGALFLGGIGFISSFYAKAILWISASENAALREASLPLLQIILLTLCLHVGCQIILKILQALDHTVASVTINLCAIYGFRVPLLLLLGTIPKSTVMSVMYILTAEKCLKLSAMLIYWRTVAQKHASPIDIRTTARAAA